MSAPATATRLTAYLARYRHAEVPVHTDGLIGTVQLDDPWHRPAPCIIRCVKCGRALNDARVLSEVEVAAPDYAESKARARRGAVTETWFLCSCGHEQLSRNRAACREWWAGLSRWRIDN